MNKREIFGHWELDTIVSGRGKSKGCLATFVERKTRFYMAIKIKDRTQKSMLKAIKQLAAQMPKEAIRTFTTDRVKEFACYKEVEKILKYRYILRSRMRHGKEEVMKIQMDY